MNHRSSDSDVAIPGFELFSIKFVDCSKLANEPRARASVNFITLTDVRGSDSSRRKGADSNADVPQNSFAAHPPCARLTGEYGACCVMCIRDSTQVSARYHCITAEFASCKTSHLNNILNLPNLRMIDLCHQFCQAHQTDTSYRANIDNSTGFYFLC